MALKLLIEEKPPYLNDLGKESLMKRASLYLIVFALIFPSIAMAGKAYYVNPGAPNGGNGSFLKPWNNIGQINSYKFSTGDDVYFKAGTKLTASDNLFIDWNGSANDRVIIGAYYGEGKFGLGGNTKPIIDGIKKIPADIDLALIQHTGPGYITIQDLQIKNSHGVGIALKEVYRSPPRKSVYNVIKDCIITDSGRQGILLSRSSNSLIENNLIDGASQTAEVIASGKLAYSGAGIEVTGMNNEALSQNNNIRGNTIRRCGESLGIYKGSRNTIVENNTIYDMAGVGIYAANSRDGIIRNNLVYGIDPRTSKNHLQPERGRRQLIWIDAERHVNSIIKVTGGWEISGNYLAGGMTGIWLQCNTNDFGVYQNNNKIFNNRIVDCNRNIWIHQAVDGWKGNEIYNNYSYIFTSELVHVYGDKSPPGVTWYSNYFNSSISGNASIKAQINAITLEKTNGWRSLPYGGVTIDFFKFNDEIINNFTPTPSNLRIIN